MSISLCKDSTGREVSTALTQETWSLTHKRTREFSFLSGRVSVTGLRNARWMISNISRCL